MGRLLRRDEPGDWFHLMNRGVARRTMFESRADIDQFFELIDEVVERGWLEVHSFSVMATHFHLMVRSPDRSLSSAMHHIQLGYVRYFNRARRRDGPLVRGRFRAMLVDSLAYRRLLVGYIDANAVKAKVVRDPAHYAFSSCAAFVRGGGPRWLQRDWVESAVQDAAGGAPFAGDRYREHFHAGFDEGRFRYLDERSKLLLDGDDPSDSLLDGAAPEVLDWMRRKARLADGTRPGMPLVPAEVISAVMSGSDDDAKAKRRRRQIHCLLLRDLAGLTFAEVGRVIGRGCESARTTVAAARRAFEEEPEVAARVAELGHRALVSFYQHRKARAGWLAAVSEPAPEPVV